MEKNSVTYEDFVVSPFLDKDGKPSNSPIEEVELALARARGIAHEAGFEAGKKSAEASFDRKLTARLGAIEQALMQSQDIMESSERAAHWAVVQLTKAFIHAVAPRLASSALVPEICAAIEDAIEDEPGALIIIEVSEDRQNEVETAVAACTSTGIVKTNPDLGETEARVYWEDGFDQIDPAATIAKAMKILDARLTKTLADQALKAQSDKEEQA